jgi:AraC-like DNA-binding protein
LVVDDDPAVREVLAAGLADRHTVHTAATGAEALASLRTHLIAAIILDAVLGDEDGLDLVEPLHVIAPVPIILLTGHSTEDLAIRAVGKIARYLKKPVSLPDLRGTLEGVLGPLGWFADPATRARHHVDTTLGDPTSARSVAGAIRLSERHVRRLFRERHGRTLRQYIAAAHLRRAEELLRTTELTIDQVARGAGWTSVPTFVRAFRRAYDLTPREYRQRIRRTGTASAAD